MSLDYQINHRFHPHYDKKMGWWIYDDLGWFVRINNEDLCKYISGELNLQFTFHPRVEKEVTEEQAVRIHDLLIMRRDLCGLWGQDYDRNIMEINKDLEE